MLKHVKTAREATKTALPEPPGGCESTGFGDAQARLLSALY